MLNANPSVELVFDYNNDDNDSDNVYNWEKWFEKNKTATKKC